MLLIVVFSIHLRDHHTYVRTMCAQLCVFTVYSLLQPAAISSTCVCPFAYCHDNCSTTTNGECSLQMDVPNIFGVEWYSVCALALCIRTNVCGFFKLAMAMMVVVEMIGETGKGVSTAANTVKNEIYKCGTT